MHTVRIKFDHEYLAEYSFPTPAELDVFLYGVATAIHFGQYEVLYCTIECANATAYSPTPRPRP